MLGERHPNAVCLAGVTDVATPHARRTPSNGEASGTFPWRDGRPGAPPARTRTAVGNVASGARADGRQKIEGSGASTERVAQAALVGEVLDRLPSELARLGVGVLPAIDRRDRDRDLVRELFLGHPQLLPEAADQVACVVVFHRTLPTTDVGVVSRATDVPGRSAKLCGRSRVCAVTGAAFRQRHDDPVDSTFRLLRQMCYPGDMIREVMVALLSAVLVGATAASGAGRGAPKTPEGRAARLSAAVKAEDYGAKAYEHISTAMRGGKDKDAWVAETKAFMAFADVKIFEFKVYDGKVEGDKARVPTASSPRIDS
jgi:hypothetical protein